MSSDPGATLDSSTLDWAVANLAVGASVSYGLIPVCMRVLLFAVSFGSCRRPIRSWNYGFMPEDRFDLIVADASVLNGQARLRGTRIAVSVVLDCLAAGMAEDGLHAEYPTLPAGAVRASLAYAARLAHEELYPLEPSPG